MNNSEIYNAFIGYISKCEEIIKNGNYTISDTKYLDHINSENINEEIIKHRLLMIKRKLNHTKRMYEHVIKVNQKLDFKIDLADTLKCAILFHDIGRFRQSTWSNTFLDKVYIENNTGFKNHGEDGYDIFINNDFDVDKIYIPVIGMSILHHLNHREYPLLCYKYDTDISKIDINSIVTGSYNFNDLEWQIASLITQIVADIDKIDILYQHLDTIDVVKDHIVDRSGKNIQETSKKWDISESEIINFNNDILNKDSIKIPVNNIKINKLKVSDFYKNCLYTNNWPPLRELMLRDDWTFVSVMYWRLGVFLSQIEFYTNLEIIEDVDLINKIYNSIDSKYKPLFSELFSYSEEVLVRKKLIDNKDHIYL